MVGGSLLDTTVNERKNTELNAQNQVNTECVGIPFFTRDDTFPEGYYKWPDTSDRVNWRKLYVKDS